MSGSAGEFLNVFGEKTLSEIKRAFNIVKKYGKYSGLAEGLYVPEFCNDSTGVAAKKRNMYTVYLQAATTAIALQNENGKNRLLIQYSEMYGKESCVNVKHIWLTIDRNSKN